jgi:inner membrane protein
MPTVLTHPAVPIAMTIGLGRTVISQRLLYAGIVFSILPDSDVIAFHFDIPYASHFGHRGFSHSILFAFLMALSGSYFCRFFHRSFTKTFLFLFLSILSHGILDAFTTGGLGVAFLWPWSAERYFAPVQMIKVSPLGLSRFFSPRGAMVLWSELRWVWLPLASMAMTAFLFRRLINQFQCFKIKNDNVE